MNDVPIKIKVNGQVQETRVPPSLLLADLLREELGLTGTKKGCDGGECGACTVLMDGVPVYSCLTLAVQADGHEILTIEGLGSIEKLHPIQDAFLDAGAVQRGYCSAGVMLSTKALLDNNPQPTDREIREALVGNLCRCTGWNKILEAVKQAAVSLRNGVSP